MQSSEHSHRQSLGLSAYYKAPSQPTGVAVKSVWPEEIQHYVALMQHADNVVKHEVLEHYNTSITKCLAAWRKQLNLPIAQSKNALTYTKKIEITDTGQVIASVFASDGRRVGLQFFTSFLYTVKSTKRNAIRAHKWADDYIALCEGFEKK